MRIILLLSMFALLGITKTFAQNKNQMDTTDAPSDLPYYQVPDYPEAYTATTVAARVIDGLGFRYYWATEGLSEKDLQFKPSEEGRTSEETLQHIYGLSNLIMNATLKQPNVAQAEEKRLTFEGMRQKTLENNRMTMEELMYDQNGRLMTNALSTYKVPDIYSVPKELEVHFNKSSGSKLAIMGSKAVGEPPLMYGIGAYFAIRDAVKAFNPDLDLPYSSPITPEKVLFGLYGKVDAAKPVDKKVLQED